MLLSAGVKAVVQPGGSIRDKEVIEAADEAGVTLYSPGHAISLTDLALLVVAGFGAGLIGYITGLASIVSYPPALLAVGLTPRSRRT